jgi:LacI family transcriptional regulator
MPADISWDSDSAESSVKPKAKRPTVTDVARLAGVGASTVSRCLRGNTNVSSAVAKRVSKAINELGYELDENARALRVGRTRTIGVILPKISNVFFSQSVQRMEEEARQRGCTLIVLTHQDRMGQQLVHLATLRRYRADGVIITCASGTTLQDVRSALPDVPILTFDSFLSAEVDSVLLNNREAARIATEHLLQHGYTSVACVTGKPEVYSFQERAAGYAEVMVAHQLEPDLITAPDYEQLRSELAMRIKGTNRPAALLSLSDFATLNILMTFDELALARKDRLPFIGFDDFGFAPMVDPPLTVIRQPIAEMVSCALKMLFRRIDGIAPVGVQASAMPGELILRRSCGCCS